MNEEKEVFITDEGVEVTVDENYFDNPENCENLGENTVDVGGDSEPFNCTCCDPNAEVLNEGTECVCDTCGGVYYVTNQS